MESRKLRLPIVGVYLLVNVHNGKLYVGSSLDVKRRIYMHVYYLKAGTHPARHLQNSWNKYGKKTFKYKILEETTPSMLRIREQFWLDKYKSYDPTIGYNVCNNTRGANYGIFKGAKNPNALLTEKDVLDIVECLNNQRSRKDIAEAFDVDIATIKDIRSGKRWAYLTEGLIHGEKNRGFCKLTGSIAVDIRESLEKGISGVELARRYSISPALVTNIKYNRIWKDAIHA